MPTTTNPVPRYVSKRHYFLRDGDIFYCSNDLSEDEASLLCETLTKSHWGYRDAASTPPLPTPKQLYSFLVPYAERPPKVRSEICSISAASDLAHFLVLDDPDNLDWEFRDHDGTDEAAGRYHHSILALRSSRATTGLVDETGVAAIAALEVAPSPKASPRLRISKQEADLRARVALKGKPPKGKRWTQRTLAKAIGCATGQINELFSWQDYDAARRLKRNGSVGSKVVSFSNSLEATTGKNDRVLKQLMEEQEVEQRNSGKIRKQL